MRTVYISTGDDFRLEDSPDITCTKLIQQQAIVAELSEDGVMAATGVPVYPRRRKLSSNG